MSNHSNKLLISNQTLSAFFEDHFKDKPVEFQPEVMNPENYPHILPPDNLVINSDIPESTEVKQILKKFKNGNVWEQILCILNILNIIHLIDSFCT